MFNFHKFNLIYNWLKACFTIVDATFVYNLQSLITWDSGNQLTYPVKFHYMGDPEDDVEEVPQESEVTGYEVMRNSDKDTDIQDIF